ncbi:MAG: hypothetical protein WD271_05130 [Acidimicrobiia bacterium]
MSDNQRVIGLDPTSGPLPTTKRREAPRPASLDGAVVGLVSNGLGESDALLHAVYCELETHAGVRAAVFVRKPSVSVPPEPMDWERLISQVTVAVAGFGG